MTEEQIFLAALEQPSPTERRNFLSRVCAGDAELLGQVERLLAAHDHSGEFWDAPGLTDANATPPSADPTLTLHAPLGEDEGEASPPGSIDDTLAFLLPSNRPDSLGLIGHYEVLQVLGKGGFGIVFRAFDEVLQRIVALKVLSHALAVTSPTRKRFLREAQSSARVRHEHVVQVYAVEAEPLPYLVMEFIPGETLQQRLDRTGPLDAPEIVRLGRQIAEGLAAAHATGLIHRDIKPANILLEGGTPGRAKITDFGLARAADDASLSQSGVLAGTPLYMAPEQAEGKSIDHRADLFSLGSVLYVMATGRPPFRASTTYAVLKRVVEETPRPIREVIPEVPAHLCDLIARLHAKQPSDRFASAREVADALAQLERPVEYASERLAPAAVAPRRSRAFRLWFVLAVALVAVFFGFSWSEAAGLTDVRGTVVRLFSPEGTLVVEVDDPAISVKVDDSDIVITGAGAQEIRLKPGRYKVEASKDGKLVRRELVTVTRNGKQQLRITQEGGEPVAARPPVSETSSRPTASAAAWERAVAALSGIEQVKAVAARLQELNPGFDGEVQCRIDHGVVRGLEFSADRVRDLSPLRVLEGLQTLTCPGSDAFKGQLVQQHGGQFKITSASRTGLSDLSPLKGLPLTMLSCFNSNVYDLTPLKGMPLESLQLGSSLVFDLSPLKGMALKELDCGFTRVSDLTPLQGMPLTLAFFGTEVADLTPLRGMPLHRLACGGRFSDITVLRGMPLQEFDCDHSNASDLTPLAESPITLLVIRNTKVTDITPLQNMKTLRRLGCCELVADLTPLKGLKLEYLDAGPRVTDLSPVAAMPLDKLEFRSIQPARDGKILRAMPTLKLINDIPVAQFWKAAGSN